MCSAKGVVYFRRGRSRRLLPYFLLLRQSLFFTRSRRLLCCETSNSGRPVSSLREIGSSRPDLSPLLGLSSLALSSLPEPSAAAGEVPFLSPCSSFLSEHLAAILGCCCFFSLLGCRERLMLFSDCLQIELLRLLCDSSSCSILELLLRVMACSGAVRRLSFSLRESSPTLSSGSYSSISAMSVLRGREWLMRERRWIRES